MANELPEVIPSVQSMPTTGWFCQTSGNARKRVAKNIAGATQDNIDTRGTFAVTGVPGHTHNTSAVVSVDANYSAYRDRAITVSAGVWGYGALNLPVGLLTDSIEPNNAEERYERAIERCVGYTVLRPENCTGTAKAAVVLADSGDFGSLRPVGHGVVLVAAKQQGQPPLGARQPHPGVHIQVAVVQAVVPPGALAGDSHQAGGGLVVTAQRVGEKAVHPAAQPAQATGKPVVGAVHPERLWPLDTGVRGGRRGRRPG